MKTSLINTAIAMPLGRLSPWFDEALNSALAQTIKVPIYLIANGLQPDEINRLCKIESLSDRIKLCVYEKRVSMVENWNRIFDVTKEQYICCLHDDDILEPWTIANLLNACGAYPDCGIYYSREINIDQNGNFIYQDVLKNSGDSKLLSSDEIFNWAISNQICATGFLIDSSKCRSIGCYDTNIHYSPDWDLYFKLAVRYGACFVDFHGGRYRIDLATQQLSSIFAKQGISVTDYNKQQLSNLSLINISPDSCQRELHIALGQQAKSVWKHFGKCLDETGKMVVKKAIKDGLLAKYLFRPEILHNLWPVNVIIDIILDFFYFKFLNCKNHQ